MISGLDQATFEYLIARYGAQFLAIEFWKCPRIADLSPLEELPGLRLAGFYWNQRATRLWNLARNPGLTGLSFEDFTRLHDLSDLQAGRSLQELAFGGALHRTSVFESLEPLAGLDGLQSLDFNARRIDDGRIEPIGELTGLTSLRFPTNMFTTRQVAWLRARLPESVKSDALAPLVQHDLWPAGDENATDVLLVGKRKPWLNSTNMPRASQGTRTNSGRWPPSSGATRPSPRLNGQSIPPRTPRLDRAMHLRHEPPVTSACRHSPSTRLPAAPAPRFRI